VWRTAGRHALVLVSIGAVAACSGGPGGDAHPDSTALDERADTAAPADAGSTAGPGGVDSATSDTVADMPRDTASPEPADTFFEGSEQVWLEARARGVTFRAVGQEPGWLLELNQNDTMRVVVDYGARELTFALPEPAVDSTTWVTTYRARSDGHTVRVDIRDEPCADVMSGERFGATVQLVLDGVRYDGCGRALALP